MLEGAPGHWHPFLIFIFICACSAEIRTRILANYATQAMDEMTSLPTQRNLVSHTRESRCSLSACFVHLYHHPS